MKNIEHLIVFGQSYDKGNPIDNIYQKIMKSNDLNYTLLSKTGKGIVLEIGENAADVLALVYQQHQHFLSLNRGEVTVIYRMNGIISIYHYWNIGTKTHGYEFVIYNQIPDTIFNSWLGGDIHLIWESLDLFGRMNPDLFIEDKIGGVIDFRLIACLIRLNQHKSLDLNNPMIVGINGYQPHLFELIALSKMGATFVAGIHAELYAFDYTNADINGNAVVGSRVYDSEISLKNAIWLKQLI